MRLRSLEQHGQKHIRGQKLQEQPLPVNGENSHANVHNVRGVIMSVAHPVA
jgi:hypothetical protein